MIAIKIDRFSGPIDLGSWIVAFEENLAIFPYTHSPKCPFNIILLSSTFA